MDNSVGLPDYFQKAKTVEDPEFQTQSLYLLCEKETI